MRVSIILFCVLGGTTLAAAQPGAPDPAGPPDPGGAVPSPPTSPPSSTSPTSSIDKGTLDDANAGRAWFMPTALTPPAGTWSFEDYELFLVGASYAVTDQFLISATTLVPITSDFYTGLLTAKLQILKQGGLRVAIQVGAAFTYENDSTTNVDGMGNVTTTNTSTTTSGGELGAAATYCLDSDCYSHIDGFVGAAFAEQNNSSVPVAFSGALVARLGRHVRLVLEADTAHLFGQISGQANGFLGWYGLRFTSRSLGVDVGFAKPFCSDCSSSTFPIGFPIVAFAYRGLD